MFPDLQRSSASQQEQSLLEIFLSLFHWWGRWCYLLLQVNTQTANERSCKSRNWHQTQKKSHWAVCFVSCADSSSEASISQVWHSSPACQTRCCWFVSGLSQKPAALNSSVVSFSPAVLPGILFYTVYTFYCVPVIILFSHSGRCWWCCCCCSVFTYIKYVSASFVSFWAEKTLETSVEILLYLC